MFLNLSAQTEIAPSCGVPSFEKNVFVNKPQNNKVQPNKHVDMIIYEQCVLHTVNSGVVTHHPHEKTYI